MTLVTPLHRPGSANAATSVCLYREQERALRYRPIVRTSGRCLPFRVHPSAHDVNRLSSGARQRGGGTVIPRPGVRDRSATARPQSRYLCSHPYRAFCNVLDAQPPAVDRLQAAMGSRHWPGTASGTGRRSPPLRAPAGDPTPIAPVLTRAKSRVLIETQELRLLPQECGFPGNNIPSIKDKNY